MTRFQRRYSTELQIAIWMSIIFVFVADLRTALGIAVWVFYIVPLILSAAGWKPALPLIVSGVVTTLTLTGLVLDQPGAPMTIAGTNRLFGVITFWAIAIIGRQFVKNKLLVMEQNWLREGQSKLAAELHGEQLLPAL